MTKQMQQIDYKISFHKKELEKYTELKEITNKSEVVYSSTHPVEKRVFIIDTDMTIEEAEELISSSVLSCKTKLTDTEEYCVGSNLEDYGASISDEYVMSVKNKQIREWSRELINLHQKLNDYKQNNERFEDLVDLLTEAGYNVSIENGDIQIDSL